ncbi:Uncharacterized protein HZ326_10121 [Fusarium oxysporum f. sp. albedinis]|nr:Uncharacterized protein HZ326_10121 [Fusarium oxysporum f. sp. albedinis]
MTHSPDPIDYKCHAYRLHGHELRTFISPSTRHIQTSTHNVQSSCRFIMIPHYNTDTTDLLSSADGGTRNPTSVLTKLCI